ncbi:hypothetical protein ASPCAL10837 [Aspergillus calidoustus]|uniref:Uncharacterized protein n=1 Tax=Aspergillus calidoustus TaxID=454130 RepID=A0A0U5G6W2_ASPCI|nr:hypothetical protein ASPCAL10837 [Aspergillus calidoustus]
MRLGPEELQMTKLPASPTMRVSRTLLKMCVREPTETTNSCHWSSVSPGTPKKTWDCMSPDCEDSIAYQPK